MTCSTDKQSLYVGASIFALATTFYIYDFVIRVIPGTIAFDLIQQYQLSAGQLGILSSLFLLGYTLMQIPCGVLFDLYGPRILMTLTMLLAASATFFFIATPSYHVALIARFFMGIGSAFAYVGPLVLAARWLPKKYFVIAAGLLQLMGSVGAIFGEAPLAKFAELSSAYTVISYIALIGILLAVAYFIFIRDYPANAKHPYQQTKFNLRVHLKYVIHHSQNWMAALYALATWAPISALGALWVVPFLSIYYAINTTQAGSLASFLWVGVGLGGPLLGWLSNWQKSRKKPLICASIAGLITSLLLLSSPNIPMPIMSLLLFLFGIAGATQAVTLGLMRDINLARYVGTATGFNNMAVVIGGTIMQPLAGVLLDWHMRTNASHQAAVYTVNNFRLAFLILPLAFFISLLIVVFLIRETHCHHQYKPE